MIKKAVAAVTVEHLGCREWLDDASFNYKATGKNEWSIAITPSKVMGGLIVDALKGSIDRAAVVNPVNGGWLGEGGGLSRAGIPTIGYIPQPNYLCAGPDNCEIDKLSGPIDAQPDRGVREGVARRQPAERRRIESLIIQANRSGSGSNASLPRLDLGVVPIVAARGTAIVNGAYPVGRLEPDRFAARVLTTGTLRAGAFVVGMPSFHAVLRSNADAGLRTVAAGQYGCAKSQPVVGPVQGPSTP